MPRVFSADLFPQNKVHLLIFTEYLYMTILEKGRVAGARSAAPSISIQGCWLSRAIKGRRTRLRSILLCRTGNYDDTVQRLLLLLSPLPWECLNPPGEEGNLLGPATHTAYSAGCKGLQLALKGCVKARQLLNNQYGPPRVL